MIVYEVQSIDGTPALVTPCDVYAFRSCMTGGRWNGRWNGYRWLDRRWPRSQPHAPAAAPADAQPTDEP